MISKAGTFAFKPVMAELKTNKNIFKADPYCVITMGAQKKRTIPSKNGKKPTWNETLIFDRTSEEILSVQLWDKDHFSSDDFIAEGSVGIDFCFKTGNQQVWIDLYSKGELVGKLLMECEVTKHANPMAQVFGPNPYANFVFGAQAQV